MCAPISCSSSSDWRTKVVSNEWIKRTLNPVQQCLKGFVIASSWSDKRSKLKCFICFSSFSPCRPQPLGQDIHALNYRCVCSSWLPVYSEVHATHSHAAICGAGWGLVWMEGHRVGSSKNDGKFSRQAGRERFLFSFSCLYDVSLHCAVSHDISVAFWKHPCTEWGWCRFM